MTGTSSIFSSSWVLPLLLCSEEAATSDGEYPFDRIRMQKAVFLLTRRGPEGWAHLYSYRPYDWGPYSRELANDLQLLTSNSLVRATPARGSRYGHFSLTEQGQTVATSLWPQLRSVERDFLVSVRSYVTKKDFNGLLREVYSAYPEFATESRWSGR